jgi:hypothetical protein
MRQRCLLAMVAFLVVPQLKQLIVELVVAISLARIIPTINVADNVKCIEEICHFVLDWVKIKETDAGNNNLATVAFLSYDDIIGL